MTAEDPAQGEIERLDREIAALLVQRDAALRAFDKQQEDHWRKSEAGHEPAAATGPTVAIPGERFSYSDMALAQLAAGAPCGPPRRLFLDSFVAAVDAVESGLADQALLPIENTMAGSLDEVYRLLMFRSLVVVAEESLLVDHVLAARPGADLTDLVRVLSHPVALLQCERFLASLSGCTLVSAPDTSRAAAAVAEDGRGDQAAVCSAACAEAHGLHVLRRGIADTPRNLTRFVLLARRPVAMDTKHPGRTSLIFTVDNRQGSLARCLEAFAQHGLNLSKLESRRRPAVEGEYLFYLDVDAWAEEPAMSAALDEVASRTNQFRVLGSYPRRQRAQADRP